MILLLDLGNSRIKWRLERQASEDCLEGVVAHNQRASLTAQWQRCGGGLKSIAITSVSNDSLLASTLQMASDIWGKVPHFIAKTEAVMGALRFCYEEPSRLGVDRALAMMAAYEQVRDDFLLIDSGSALTADYVSATGEHQGGYIVPGLRMLSDALLQGTANIRVDHVSGESVGLGCSTEECVAKGVYRMYAATIREFREEAQQRNIEHILITGGDALVASEILDGGRVEQGLVLNGLSLWLRQRLAG